MPGRRALSFFNNDGATTIYILESSTQTVTDGWEIPPAQTVSLIGSETFTANNNIAGTGIEPTVGFYLAVSAGTAVLKVLEGL